MLLARFFRAAHLRASPGLTGSTALLIAAVLVPLVSAAADSPAAPTAPPIRADAQAVEFWTIAANEGQSSGGHSAIRIGEHVHHLQHRGDGLIEYRRDRRDAFELAYRGRGNRGIHSLELALPDQVAFTLAELLSDRAVEDRIRLDRLEALDEDLRWLKRLTQDGYPTIILPGLALFEKSQPHACRPATPSSADRRRELIRAIAAARPIARAAEQSALRAATSPDVSEPEPQLRPLIDATLLRRALTLAAQCRRLDDGRLTPLVDHAFDPELWRSIEAKLESNLLRLIESRREDRGLAILLTAARLSAARSSLARETLLVVNGFAEGDAIRRVTSQLPLEIGWQAAREARADSRVARSLEGLTKELPAAMIESRLDRIERSAHTRMHAQTDSRHSDVAPRGALETSRALERPTLEVRLAWPSPSSFSGIEKRIRALAAKRARLRGALGAKQSYSLVSQNCVTELLRTFDEALATSPETSRTIARRRQHLAAPLGFSPWIAHSLIADSSPIARHAYRTSAREEAIDRLGAEFSIARALRESNTLTSTTYRAHSADSTFLFFAENPVSLRPLIGAANLLAATTAGAAGLIAAPFDRGTLLTRSARGVVMSLPELIFLSIRKGSYVGGPTELSPPRISER